MKCVRRIGVLVLVLALVCCVASTAFAVTVPYEAVFDGVYRLEASGVLTASSVSATNTVYKIETDLPVRDIYRTSRVDYQYYPQGDGGLEPGYKFTSTQSALSCVATESTSSNTNIYTFRYATFTFTAKVPAASGGYHNWSVTSPQQQVTH